jgi:AhpD family alkylhydroperoxidase
MNRQGDHVMRIEPCSVSAAPWYLRPFFWNQRRKYGEVLNAALLWARVPRLFLSVALLYGALDRRGSPLDPALRSLVTVRVSQLNACEFCVDINAATLLQRGVATAKVEALASWRESRLFDARERAALDYAEAMTLSDGVAQAAFRRRRGGRADRADRVPEHVGQVQQRPWRSGPGVLPLARLAEGRPGPGHGQQSGTGNRGKTLDSCTTAGTLKPFSATRYTSQELTPLLQACAGPRGMNDSV